MRTEFKVGLIVGFVIVVGVAFYALRDTGSELENAGEIPFDVPVGEVADKRDLTLQRDAAPENRTSARPNTSPRRTTARENRNRTERNTPGAEDASGRTPPRATQRPATRIPPVANPSTPEPKADTNGATAPPEQDAKPTNPTNSEASDTQPQSQPLTPLERLRLLQQESARRAAAEKPADRPVSATPENKPSNSASPATPKPESADDADKQNQPANTRVQTPKPQTPRTGRVTPAERLRQLKKPSDTPKPYKIKQGDTFSSIARNVYGDEKYWVRIRDANPNVNPTALQIGQEIVLPPKDKLAKDAPDRDDVARAARSPLTTAPGIDRATYVVDRGDTLIGIARNVLGDAGRWHEIYELNKDKLASPDVLHAGTKLRLPPVERKRLNRR